MPVDPTLMEVAFGMKPEEAVRFLREKGVAIPTDYKQMLAAARARAFAVAGVARLDVLQEVLDLVTEAVDGGQTLEEFKKELPGRLERVGWSPADDNPLSQPWRLTNIFRTNVQTALMASRYNTLQRVRKTRELWQYVAIQDRRTRPSHAALNGRIYPADSPFWQSYFPPNGFLCRCDVITYSRAEADDLGLAATEGGEAVDVEVPSSKKRGGKTTVRAWRDKDGTIHTPDAGFDNPPTGEYKPDLSNYDPALAKAYTKAQQGGKFAEILSTVKQMLKWY